MGAARAQTEDLTASRMTTERSQVDNRDNNHHLRVSGLGASAVWVKESIRLDLGYGSQVHP